MPYNIVIACIDTRNPPETLKALDGPDVTVHRVIGFGHNTAELYHSADAIITELHAFNAATIATLERCRIIACASTGYDYVDLAAAAQRGIWVTNCPGYCTDEVATHTIALILSQARRLPQTRQLVLQGEWDPRPVRPLPHVRGQTLGLIGYGRIGKAVAAKGKALGFRVLVCDPYVDESLMRAAGVEPASREAVLRESDYVSLHTPLTDETRDMIDAAALALMKPAAYLVNTARGVLVVEDALLGAIRAGTIAGAAIDVLSVEPPAADHPYLHDDRIIVTPHCAWCSEEADEAVWEWAAGYVVAALRGERPAAAVNQIN
ncbi:MAG: C-terminal binding protein [Anaerolineales bacterium]